MPENLRIAAIALLSAATGALLVLLFMGNEAPSTPAANDTQIEELHERLAALESRLATTDLANNAPPAADVPQSLDTTSRQVKADEPPVEQRLSERREQQAASLTRRLREAGWSDTEIDSLTELRSRAALEFEQQRYDAMRQRLEENPEELAFYRDRQNVLRETLGDDRYEQYLLAAGRSVAAGVREVLAGSAGELAGLQPGDRIRRYGTTRVFNDRDLMFAQLDGDPGEPVSIEIERNGTTFHVTVPRGPLGVAGAARFNSDF